MHHRSVAVEHPSGPIIDVDEDLAELVPLLWQAGVETEQSCQDMGGLVWLVLASVDELLRLLEIVGVYDPDPDSLYQRLADHEVAAHDSTAPKEPTQWRYRLNPFPLLDPDEWDDDADEPAVPTGLGRVPWATNVTVEFPHQDIRRVTELVRGYVNRGAL